MRGITEENYWLEINFLVKDSERKRKRERERMIERERERER